MKKIIVFSAVVGIFVFVFALFFEPYVKNASNISYVEFFSAQDAKGQNIDSGSEESLSQGSQDIMSNEITGWPVEAFDHIQVGVSTKKDLIKISPRFTYFQRGRGEVLQFPLKDGRTIEFVCQDGVVSEISFRG